MNNIDVNGLSLVRGVLTFVLMLSFITLVVWLYARKHRDAYDAAARLPLEDRPLELDVSPVNSQTNLRRVSVDHERQ